MTIDQAPDQTGRVSMAVPKLFRTTLISAKVRTLTAEERHSDRIVCAPCEVSDDEITGNLGMSLNIRQNGISTQVSRRFLADLHYIRSDHRSSSERRLRIATSDRTSGIDRYWNCESQLPSKPLRGQYTKAVSVRQLSYSYHS
jgi:hypothetical protein